MSCGVFSAFAFDQGTCGGFCPLGQECRVSSGEEPQDRFLEEVVGGAEEPFAAGDKSARHPKEGTEGNTLFIRELAAGDKFAPCEIDDMGPLFSNCNGTKMICCTPTNMDMDPLVCVNSEPSCGPGIASDNACKGKAGGILRLVAEI